MATLLTETTITTQNLTKTRSSAVADILPERHARRIPKFQHCVTLVAIYWPDFSHSPEVSFC